MRSLIALGLALLAAPAIAQPTFGLRAGLNVADVSNTFEDLDGSEFGVEIDAQPRLGFVGGVFAELPLTPSFAVRPELLFSQKGTKAVGSSSGSTEEVEAVLAIDYLEIPVLARVAVPVSPFLEVGLMAGPAVGFKLSESLEVDGEDASEGDEDAVASTDYGVVLGGEIGSGPFFVDLRYTLGLASVAAEDLGENEDTPRNGVFSVTGTFKFGR